LLTYCLCPPVAGLHYRFNSWPTRLYVFFYVHVHPNADV